MSAVYPVRAAALVLATALLASTAGGAPAWAQEHPAEMVAPEVPFLAADDAAMDKMMKDMTDKPTGDVDRDFVAMMVPHHQGAIDMAEALLRYGRNEQLRRLAQEIIVTQQQEIAAMRLAIGEALPPSVPAPDQPPPASTPMLSHTMPIGEEP
jgi:hypothetical protein